MIEEQIDRDLKTAMLARDTDKISTLRGLKSTFLYAKVAAGTRDSALSDEEAIKIMQKEAKKRQESADLYASGGEQGRSEQELKEKAIIENYLPAQLSDQEIEEIVDQVMSSNSETNMGNIISLVKSKTSGSADGSSIARIVRSKLGQ